MKYDFNKVIDRTGTDSLKWEKAKGMLPMWVADMDIETFPGIQEAIRQRAAHGIYGYTIYGDAWFDAYIYWWKTRHSFEIKREWLRFTTGVIPAMSSAIRRLSDEGDNVIVQSPVYPAFFRIIKSNQRKVLENNLIYNRETASYSINWTDLEEKLSDPNTKLMILCNPQNPSGNIWDTDTLGRIGDLCAKYKVTVLSDEIHCDITARGKEYVPFASVSELNKKISVTFISPTKAFNAAGIQTAALFIPDQELRRIVTHGLSTDSIVEGNCFSMEAVTAAFTEEGADWLDQLRMHIWNNRRIAEDYIRKNMPVLKVVPSDSTYLMWVDCSEVVSQGEDFSAYLENEARLMVNSGKAFGGNGDCFIRVNLACPESLLKEGMERLKIGVAKR
ncbi:cystathione beta-lyase [Lachnospiraceae bacterium]|nr:cystathione beta-lyase [Lachnospiraceae bacterium]